MDLIEMLEQMIKDPTSVKIITNPNFILLSQREMSAAIHIDEVLEAFRTIFSADLKLLAEIGEKQPIVFQRANGCPCNKCKMAAFFRQETFKFTRTIKENNLTSYHAIGEAIRMAFVERGWSFPTDDGQEFHEPLLKSDVSPPAQAPSPTETEHQSQSSPAS